jgi:hypothetical protein
VDHAIHICWHRKAISTVWVSTRTECWVLVSQKRVSSMLHPLNSSRLSTVSIKSRQVTHILLLSISQRQFMLGEIHTTARSEWDSQRMLTFQKKLRSRTSRSNRWLAVENTVCFYQNVTRFSRWAAETKASSESAINHSVSSDRWRWRVCKPMTSSQISHVDFSPRLWPQEITRSTHVDLTV